MLLIFGLPLRLFCALVDVTLPWDYGQTAPAHHHCKTLPPESQTSSRAGPAISLQVIVLQPLFIRPTGCPRSHSCHRSCSPREGSRRQLQAAAHRWQLRSRCGTLRRLVLQVCTLRSKHSTFVVTIFWMSDGTLMATCSTACLLYTSPSPRD